MSTGLGAGPPRGSALARAAIVCAAVTFVMTLAGFQFTARFKEGGAQAGSLVAAPDEEKRIRIEVQNDVQYAGQRQAGTALVAPDAGRWALVWTAPKASAPVLFRVSANRADNDDSVHGDYIHTAVVETVPADLDVRSPR